MAYDTSPFPSVFILSLYGRQIRPNNHRYAGGLLLQFGRQNGPFPKIQKRSTVSAPRLSHSTQRQTSMSPSPSHSARRAPGTPRTRFACDSLSRLGSPDDEAKGELQSRLSRHGTVKCYFFLKASFTGGSLRLRSLKSVHVS